MKRKIIAAALLMFATISSAFAAADTLSFQKSPQQHNWHYLGGQEGIQPLRRLHVEYDVAVIGGGMSGIAAAVAAARQGASVVLVNDRSVLGGNASSEIRVTVNSPKFERNTGVAEEILIANRKYNPQESYPVWDHVLYDYVVKEPNITLMLDTSAIRAECEDSTINEVVCWQSNSETEVRIKAQIFIDATGDGVVGASAGAEYRTGREGKAEFGEKFAPDEPDGWVMGESIMMITREMDQPVPFYAPSYAIEYIPGKGGHRKINGLKGLKEGFWWVELGSQNDVIEDRPRNTHDLKAYFYGVWDYVKNSGKFPEATNLALEWIGSVPGKRESRRLIGDYILTEVDLMEYKEFDDAVAWGGWSLDEHAPGGILSLDEPASYFHDKFDRPYQIPYRVIYSKNINNLYMAGRDVSVSHLALSSTRIIETCMSLGQAAGVAAAMCVEKSVSPRQIYNNHIEELQEELQRRDYYIPYLEQKDPNNIAKKATVTASSTSSGAVENLFDGFSRDRVESGEIHHWQSLGTEAVLNLDWKKAVKMNTLELKFDTEVRRPIMMHKDPKKNINQIPGIPPELVRSFSVEAKIDGQWQEVATIKENIVRYVVVELGDIKTDALRIKLHDTYGANNIKMYHVGVYME
ncbi:MAG: FAD-dependent oxidoreductase [Rikenellaceae bacterium]